MINNFNFNEIKNKKINDLDNKEGGRLDFPNLKERKVILVNKQYDDVENVMAYGMDFNNTYELVEYLRESGIVKNNDKGAILSNISNVASGLAKGLNRSLNKHRVYIEGINFVIKNGKIEPIGNGIVGLKAGKGTLNKDVVEEILIVFKGMEDIFEDLSKEEILKSFENDTNYEKAGLIDKILNEIRVLDVLFKILAKKSNYIEYEGFDFRDFTCVKVLSDKNIDLVDEVGYEISKLKNKIDKLKEKLI